MAQRSFDGQLWGQIAARLREVIGNRTVAEILKNPELRGVKLHAVVAGRSGMDVGSLTKVCWALDISPSWLLFDVGQQKLSYVQDRAHRKTIIKSTQHQHRKKA